MNDDQFATLCRKLDALVIVIVLEGYLFMFLTFMTWFFIAIYK